MSFDRFCYCIQLSWPRNGSLNPEFRGLLFTTEENSQEFSCILEYSYAKATQTAEQEEYAFISRQFCLNKTPPCPP